MGNNRFLVDSIVRNGIVKPLVSFDYHPSFPPSKIQNIWTDYVYKSKHGNGSGWGCFIIDNNNRHIDFEEVANGGGELTATLALGSYDAVSLCTEIAAKMTAVGTHGYTYTVTYSDNSNKFTISFNGDSGWFDLFWQSGSHSSTSVGMTVGYDTSADDTGGTSYAGDFVRIHSNTGLIIESGDGSAVASKGCALFGLNLTSSYQILEFQRWLSGSWSKVGDFDYDFVNKRAIIFYSEISAIKYRILIRDWTNSAGYIQIGVAPIGNYEEIGRGYEYGARDDLDDTSAHQYSKKGYLSVIRGYLAEAKAVVYEVLSVDEEKLESIYRQVGKHYPFVFVGDSDNAKNTMEYVIFAGKFGRRIEDSLFKQITLIWKKVN